MKTNVHYRDDLIVAYLVLLVQTNNQSVFLEYYEKAEAYLTSLAKTSTDVRVLENIQQIFAFKSKQMGIQL